MKRLIVVLAVVGLVLALPALSVAQAVDSYHAAIDRFVVSYSHGTVDVRVAVGDNTPAEYTLETWTKGSDVAVSVIVKASASFMLGLAVLENGDSMTAWWPTIEEEKTFDVSQSEEEIGFGLGRLDKVIWHSADYTATPMKETLSTWEYRITPNGGVQADFKYAVVAVNKADGTLVRADFFDANGKLIETDTVSNFQEIAKESGDTLLYPMNLTYEDYAGNKKTTMNYSKIEFPASIDNSTFTIDFLKAESAKVIASTSTP